MPTTNIPIRYGAYIQQQGFTGEEILRVFKKQEDFIEWGMPVCFHWLSVDDRIKALEQSWIIINQVMNPVAGVLKVEESKQIDPLQEDPKENINHDNDSAGGGTVENSQ